LSSLAGSAQVLDQQKARTALDTLDEKLAVGTITDERYKARAEKHEETLARTKRLLEGSSSDAKAWLELSNEVCRFELVFEQQKSGSNSERAT